MPDDPRVLLADASRHLHALCASGRHDSMGAGYTCSACDLSARIDTWRPPMPAETPPADGDLREPVAEGSYEWYRREVERLRGELANRDTLLAKYRETVSVLLGQRDTLRAAAQAALDRPNVRKTVQMLRDALDAPSGAHSPTTDPLHTAIECVLLDHADQIGGETADPNISELAHAYRQRTGWTAEQETAGDAATATDGPHSPTDAEEATTDE
jgi:hypothetical protein